MREVAVILALILGLTLAVCETSFGVRDPIGRAPRTSRKIVGRYPPERVTKLAPQLAPRRQSPVTPEFSQGMVMATWSSWYGPGFHGQKTASGEVFNMYDISTAHPSLPLGTILRIRNPANGRVIKAEVTDRGPYFEDRGLDLSYQAAVELRFVEEGVVWLEYEIIEPTE